MIVEHQITCLKCDKSKSSNEYYLSDLKRGHRRCKVCSKLYQQKYRKTIHKEILITEEDVLKLLVELHINRNRKIAKGEVEHIYLTREQIYNLLRQQDFKCAYLNINFVGITNKLFYPSIDRIDSNYGYREDNVQIICRGLNLAKSNSSDKDFREFLLSIKENYI